MGTVSVETTDGVEDYQVSVVEVSGTYNYECGKSRCSYDVEAGLVDVFIEKAGYYVETFSVELEGGEVYEHAFAFEIVPGLASEFEAAVAIDEEVFEGCYGVAEECGLDDYYLAADEETGYMTLFYGDYRKATFTKGMADGVVFVEPDESGALVYDGAAYYVDFGTDSRELLFEADGMSQVKFGDGGYLIEAKDVVYWYHGELEVLEGLEFSGVTIFDEKIYYVGYEDDVAVIGSYDGNSYYVISEIDVPVEGALVANDDEGVYVKSGEEMFLVRE